MLAAGMFEYNFGDSEFLMLFLVLITLPFAAMRARARSARDRSVAAGLLDPDLVEDLPRVLNLQARPERLLRLL